jgi:hypothetical protein
MTMTERKVIKAKVGHRQCIAQQHQIASLRRSRGWPTEN